MQFMVEEKGFRLWISLLCGLVFSFYFNVILMLYLLLSEDRIRNGVKKMLKSRQGSTQGRLDSFFKVLPSPVSAQKRVWFSVPSFHTAVTCQLFRLLQGMGSHTKGPPTKKAKMGSGSGGRWKAK